MAKSKSLPSPQLSTQLPPAAVQRELLSAKIAEWQNRGFTISMEIATLEAQTVSTPAEKKARATAIPELRVRRANCEAAARRLTQMLKQLPAAPDSQDGE